MDGAWLGSIDIAMKKAKTSVFFDMPCSKLGELSQPGGPLFGIEHSNQGLITFPGNVFDYSQLSNKRVGSNKRVEYRHTKRNRHRSIQMFFCLKE